MGGICTICSECRNRGCRTALTAILTMAAGGAVVMSSLPLLRSPHLWPYAEVRAGCSAWLRPVPLSTADWPPPSAAA